MVASKLLANSDRWRDDSVFRRDVIDLAMMNPAKRLFQQATTKAETAYGPAIPQDLGKAIDLILANDGRLERCMKALSVRLPKALLWQKICDLKRRL
jgi:hypothetical protein